MYKAEEKKYPQQVSSGEFPIEVWIDML